MTNIRTMTLVLLCGWVNLAVVGQELKPEPSGATPSTQELFAQRDKLWEEARQLAAGGETAAAIQASEGVLALERELYDETHEELAVTLDWLARRNLDQSEAGKAVALATESLAIREALEPSERWKTINTRNMLDFATRLSKADPEVVRQMMAIREKASAMATNEQYAEAAAKLRERLAMEETLLGTDHPFYAVTLKSIGDWLELAKEYASAEQAAADGLAIRKRHLGVEHPDTASAAWLLALTRFRQEKYEAVLEPLELARDAWTSTAQLTDAAWMESWRGDTLAALQRDDEAAVAYQASLEAFRELGDLNGEMTQVKELADLDDSVEISDQRNALWEQAQALRSEGNLVEATAVGERMLALEIAWLGQDHDEVATSRKWLADVKNRGERDALWEQAQALKSEGNVAEALAVGKRMLELEIAWLGQDHDEVATSREWLANTESRGQRDALWEQARELKVEGKWEDAAAVGERMLELEIAWLGEDNDEIIVSREWLAGVYESAENWAAATSGRQEVLARRLRADGEDHWHVIDARLALQHLELLQSLTGEQREQLRVAEAVNRDFLRLDDERQFTEAIEAGRKALEIRGEILGDEHPDYATSLFNLADTYESVAEYAKAEPLYIQSLAIRERIFGKEHPSYGLTLNDLAYRYDSMANYGAAEPLYLEALELRSRLYGKESSEYATSLNNLGLLYKSIGNFIKAEPMYREALQIRAKVLGVEHQDYATVMNNLGSLYETMGDYTKAERLYLQATEIDKTAVGEHHPGYAIDLNNLALLYKKMGKSEEAESLFIEALDIYREAYTEMHPAYATTLNNLALLYANNGDYEKAEPLYRQALEIDKQTLGKKHPGYAIDLNNMAGFYMAMQEFEKAESYYTEGLEIHQAVFGDDHPAVATGLNNLAVLYEAMGDFERAEQYAHRALADSRDLLERNAIILSERQQLLMSQMLRYRLDSYLSLALDSGQFEDSAARQVLAWKGATLIRQRAARLAADDPRVADRFRELQEITKQLASLSRSTPVDVEAWRELLRTRNAEKEILEAQLIRDSAAFREAAQKVELAQIQAAMPADSVLIDYLQFNRSKRTDVPGRWDSEQALLAIVILPNGPPRMLDLGPVSRLGEAIDTWRDSFGNSTEAAVVASYLRHRVWEPLLEHIANAKTVLVSTDGVLGRLPLGALPGKEEGTYLLEDHRLAMIPVPQLLPALINNLGLKELDRELLLMGDVDYDADPEDAAVPAKRERRSRQRAAGFDERFRSLPGTGGEIATIERAYRNIFNLDADDVVTLDRARATEARFMELAPQFYHLHLATHGFFASAANPSALSADALLAARDAYGGSRWVLATDDIGVIGLNPGLLSGLAFAGANREPTADGDDGILTAQEIAFLPLGGVDTVVLSACETGLGEVAGGEGLLGVQCAFQVSGARTTVASFWKVDDLVTRVLMERFYRNLWEKEMSRLDALRESQLFILHNPEVVREAVTLETDEPTRTSPFYWGAFVLSGDWR